MEEWAEVCAGVSGDGELFQWDCGHDCVDDE